MDIKGTSNGCRSRKMKNWQKVVAWLCVAGYVFAILYKTVLIRSAADVYNYIFLPFWSYAAIIDGRETLIKEHILNVALFIPLGAFLWSSLKQKLWWKALLFGCAVSISIEILQLLLKRGLCELDDVFHNTLGCLIGYGIISLMALLWRKVTDSKKC